MTESQQRFLKEISERVTTGRIAEVRLFPTLRTGPVDSGVAIVAVEDLVPVAVERAEPIDAAVAVEVAEATESAPGTSPEVELVEPEQLADAVVGTEDVSRLSILTARFRHTVKGPDRGKWEFEMVHDADAPQATIENVVRGVASRAGEDGEPDLLTADDLQHALTEPWWTAQA